MKHLVQGQIPISSSPTLRGLFVATLLVSAPSMALYAWGRASGALPTEAAWEAQGGNHGPWHGEGQSIVITLGLLASLPLPLISFFYTIGLSIAQRKASVLVEGMALTVFQLACLYAMVRIFWVID